MALDPRPFKYVAPSGSAPTHPAPEPVTIYDIPSLPGAVDSVNGDTGDVVLDASDVGAVADSEAVIVALLAAGFGTAGQVLATNASADGFEWITP